MPRNLSTKVISCSRSTITLLQRYGMKFAKTIMKFVRDPLVLAYSSKIRHQHFLCIYMKQQTHRQTTWCADTKAHNTHAHTHTRTRHTNNKHTQTHTQHKPLKKQSCYDAYLTKVLKLL